MRRIIWTAAALAAVAIGCGDDGDQAVTTTTTTMATTTERPTTTVPAAVTRHADEVVAELDDIDSEIEDIRAACDDPETTAENFECRSAYFLRIPLLAFQLESLGGLINDRFEGVDLPGDISETTYLIDRAVTANARAKSCTPEEHDAGTCATDYGVVLQAVIDAVDTEWDAWHEYAEG